MNKQQIKAELRRSALYGITPMSCDYHAYEAMCEFRTMDYFIFENPFDLKDSDWRTFFLLVSEAL